MRAFFYQLILAAIVNTAVLGPAVAEEFKYYVWIDDEGIVHASQEAPKGRDYKVRIIEDVNANVVPAEDFHPYGEPPPPPGSDSEPTPAEKTAKEQPGETTEGDEDAKAGQ